jgi:hypothetical protein
MEKNKTGKYFKYAIGEIILVVIGILIALQINNWNENRKTDLLAKGYLIDIKKDLITDTLTFDTAIKRVRRTIEKNKLLLNTEYTNTASTDTIISFLGTSFHSTRIYHIDNSTYLKLSNTGFLESGLFNSAFTEINNYYNKEYVTYSEFIEWDKEQSIDLFHPDFLGIYKNIDLPSLVLENKSLSNPQKEKSSIKSLIEFINSSQFRNSVWSNYNRKKAVLDRLLVQNKLASNLIEKIDKELKNK